MTDKKTLLDFPCDFPIKVMGKTSVEFEALVVTTIRPFVPDLGEGAVRTRPSKDGNYIAITVTITARSQNQLDDIYRALTALEETLMVL